MERITRELELYTIPSYSSWFSWINIHEVERFSLREFFDGSSITRTPRIYKEYRDFIITKYREDPSRKLSFTEVRKSLVGDISVLHKVFTFLVKWGLINFNVSGSDDGGNSGEGGSGTTSFEGKEEGEGEWKGRVKVEEGAPHGVRVVAAPNSMKPLVPPPPPPSVGGDGGGVVGEVGESGFKWPPLASYSDVYGELMLQEETNKGGVVCGNCKENCDSKQYEYTKEESFILCEKCFESGNYEKEKSADDFKLKDTLNQAVDWTEAETLLLLESILKQHGDDWDLVSKNVQTKSKLECISKLMQLPFGDLMLGAGLRNGGLLDIIGDGKQAAVPSNESLESAKAEEPSSEVQNKDQQNGDAKCEGPPRKRVCTGPTSDAGNYMMKQVTRISTMLDPHITASAADAAVTSLCYENQCSRELFDDNDGNYFDSIASPEASNPERDADGDADNAVGDKSPNPSEIVGISSVKNIIPLNLKTRAATATSLGVAAANAKMLADKEEKEIGNLVAIMIETQLKKLQDKVKHFEDLELIMESENAQLEEAEQSLIMERLDVLQRAFDAGIPRSKVA
ncbi:SWI/SNF complex subunit SWI3A [Salvia divinorum]|uniref:SWI/SNF complex subunit SWI3A n=1 Tax=Salvia divinorum TaxID=28513 RepID=A0ABD1GCG6_SALDI